MKVASKILTFYPEVVAPIWLDLLRGCWGCWAAFIKYIWHTPNCDCLKNLVLISGLKLWPFLVSVSVLGLKQKPCFGRRFSEHVWKAHNNLWESNETFHLMSWLSLCICVCNRGIYSRSCNYKNISIMANPEMTKEYL